MVKWLFCLPWYASPLPRLPPGGAPSPPLAMGGRLSRSYAGAGPPGGGARIHQPTEVVEEPEVVVFLDSDSEVQSQGEEELANPPNPTHSEPLVDSTNVPSSSGDRIGFMSDPACLEENWGTFYRSCPRWKDVWVATQNTHVKWPHVMKLNQDKMT